MMKTKKTVKKVAEKILKSAKKTVSAAKTGADKALKATKRSAADITATGAKAVRSTSKTLDPAKESVKKTVKAIKGATETTVKAKSQVKSPLKTTKTVKKDEKLAKKTEKTTKPLKKSIKNIKNSVKEVRESQKASSTQPKKLKKSSDTKNVGSSLDHNTIQHSFSPEYLVLMQKDPNWLQAFWELSETRLKDVKNGKEKLVLRLFDVASDLTVRRSKKQSFQDIEVPLDAKTWYVQNHYQEKSALKMILGTEKQGKFSPILETGEMKAFSFESIQPNTDDLFFKASLGGATIGKLGSSGVSSDFTKDWLDSLSSSSESMYSGALSSGALFSNEFGEHKDSIQYGKDFFLWVKTRLIVYGGTKPDAHLQVRGKEFPLNSDGTFSFEMDLPDSTQVIPVFATDKDGDFPTTIVPIVVKRTE